MSVASMLKVTVIGYRPVMDKVIEALQRAGVLQIEATPHDLTTEHIAPDDERLRSLDEHVAEAHFARDFLGRYHTNEQPFSAFVSEKFHLPFEEYLKLGFDAHTKRVYHECLSISDKLAAGERERDRLGKLIHDLAPWEDLHFQISRWCGTETTRVFAGTVSAADSAKVRQQLRDEAAEVTVEEMGPVGDRQAWLVIAHKSVEARVRTLLAAASFNEVTFPGLSDTPAEELACAVERREALGVEAEKLNERAQKLSDENYDRTVALVEALDSIRDQLVVRGEFGRTDYVFVISGWVIEDAASRLESSLEAFGDDIDLTLESPSEGDRVPVQLRNPKLIRPFEVLTDLYGRPSYGELDPTPLMAPFFLAFFGICIGDVGYGLMLIVGSWLIKTRLDVAPGVKRFLNLLMLGGVSAMAFGVAFGSYFALPVDSLPPFLRNLQVLDPLAELTTFLIFTLVLGIMQVFFGVLVAAYDAFRRGNTLDGVFGQLSTIFMFVMIGVYAVTKQGLALSIGLVATMLMQGGAIQAALGSSDRPLWDRMIGWVWLAAAIVSSVIMGLGNVGLGLELLVGASLVGVFVSKTARAAVLGLLGGAYSVYGMSAFVGDTLSYTRLAALGLSGALVGMVFNLLAGLVWGPAMALFGKGGISVVFAALIAVMAVAVFVVGHVFNVVINLLGAFVHPARLQFVEFFSKFYEAGGYDFEPFSVRQDHLVLEAGDAGSEGGAG